MRLLFLGIILLFSINTFSKEKVLGRKYFLKPFGHLHKSASRQSNSVTIVQCSHSVQLLQTKTVIDGWSYAKVGEDRGYIQNSLLGNKRPKCFQGRYPKFYSNMKLDITDMYYWGRLYDQYRSGRSKVQ